MIQRFFCEVAVPKRYECWADHREDLTQQVVKAYDDDQIVVGMRDDGTREWTVVVTCSANHKNSFTGVGQP